MYYKLKEGHYTFESIVGRQFDDNVYELYQRIKQREEQAKEEKVARKEKRRQQIQKLEKIVTPSRKRQKSESKTRLEDFDRDMQEQIIAVLRKKKRNEDF